MKDWNAIDKLIGRIRYAHVQKYIRRGMAIVDVGCGRNADFLMRNRDIIKEGIGLDFRVKNVREQNITLINNRDLKAFPIADDIIDVVFLNAVLEHLTDPISVLSESKRILKKEGKIVLTTPTRMARPILEFMAFKLHIINEDEISEHQHYFSKEDCVLLGKRLEMYLEKYSYFEVGLNSLIVYRK